MITATRVTPGSQDEGDLLTEMIQSHEQNTQKTVTTAVGNSRYGTIENFIVGHDLGIRSICLPWKRHKEVQAVSGASSRGRLLCTTLIMISTRARLERSCEREAITRSEPIMSTGLLVVSVPCVGYSHNVPEPKMAERSNAITAGMHWISCSKGSTPRSFLSLFVIT